MMNRLVVISLIAISLTLALTPAMAVMAQVNPPPYPPVVELQKTASVPWYVGAILFILIAAGVTAFKARSAAGRKRPVIAGACCLPVIEEGARPFLPADEAADGSPGRTGPVT